MGISYLDDDENSFSPFLSYMPLAKICVKAIAPEPYGIDSWIYTVRYIIARRYGRNKNGNLLSLFLNSLLLASFCVQAITTEPYGMNSCASQMGISYQANVLWIRMTTLSHSLFLSNLLLTCPAVWVNCTQQNMSNTHSFQNGKHEVGASISHGPFLVWEEFYY